MKKITIDEMHKLLLDIAKTFHSICLNNGIEYYMLGGTMLGAIRHKGFIPWDDDMDFGVPRQNYEKLLKILKRELPENLRVRDMQNSPINTDVFKIELKGTQLIEDGNKSPWGIFIDVFPLDYTSQKLHLFSTNWFLNFLVRYNNYANPSKKEYGLKGMVLYIVSKINPMKKEFLSKLIHDYSLKNYDGRYKKLSFANFYGFWGLKEIIDYSAFYPPVLYNFENIMLYGVSNYDYYLSSLYGDYHVLPPIEKRHVHCSEILTEVDV